MRRQEKIKQRLFEKEYVTKKTWWGEDKTILICDEVASEPLVMRKALAIEFTMRNMPIGLKPDEWIVGMRTPGSAGLGRTMPTYALPEEEAAAAEYSFSSQSIWGHHPAKFETILTQGIVGIRSELCIRINEELSKPRPDEETVRFCHAMFVSIGSVQCLADRYVRLLCEAANKETDAVRRTELLEMARVCSRVPLYPAETFHEALQSVFFLFCALHSTMEFVPIGRADQFLYPYYVHDREQGILSEEKARELLSSWIAKLAEVTETIPAHWEVHRATPLDFSGGGDPSKPATFVARGDAEDNYGVAANNVLNNIILGGLRPDGTSAVNELTYMLLEEWAFLEPVTPVVSVRLNEQTPEKLYHLCADILRKGSGEPALYNDSAIIAALCHLGISREEALGYSNDGCWEILIPGKTNFAFEFVELQQMLEYTLMRGRSLVRNRQEAPDPGDPCAYATFEELYAAFLTLVEQKIRALVKTKIDYYRYRSQIAPSPLLSAVMDDCIERGKDVYTGGARYNIFTLMLTEASTCIDSLAALKKLIYEDGLITMEQMCAALQADFVGYEAVRQLCSNKTPKFGNDNKYADALAVRLLNDCAEITERVRQTQDTDIFQISLGIGTFEHYEQLGCGLGASPDGRRMHDTVASNFSPSVGMDANGPTAAILSVTKTCLERYATGCMLDLQINANECQGEEGLVRLIGLIKAYLELGGQVITLTGVSESEMLDAQIHPEKHRSLRVRIGGFSAYFIALSKTHQDIMIRRVKHGV